ncbi:trehalose-phosphatase [Geobacter luticola]|uniref:Trehalose 6-phosphate phosphatase n=2 Tax=Geomobilimonas luticola TaxID=1114878 RepID=A0ABS5SJC8_9BACT|nr:trehalose-phosphatase [Geomobilimonas luticola]
MTYLFSYAGRTILRRFVDRATLFAFDLDGTLAPIVADPDRIQVPQGVQERLIRLNLLAPVVIITGRALADARKHLGFTPCYLVGNHGAEGLPGREQQEEEFCRQCSEWLEQLKILMPHASGCGIFIENKGATLSLHYRNASDPNAVSRKLVQAISRLKPPPRRIPGKYVENIVPYGAPHKGEALSQLMLQTGCSKALFVGDDATDEDVFSLANDRILGVRVGCEGSSLADCCLFNQREILDVLDEIIQLTLKTKDLV